MYVHVHSLHTHTLIIYAAVYKNVKFIFITRVKMLTDLSHLCTALNANNGKQI